MPYVKRDENGHVVGRYAVAQPAQAEEWLDDGHPDLSYKSPEKLAEEAQQVVDTAAKDTAKLDAVIQYLVSHTPDECYAKVQADVTDLASAKVMLGRFAKALSVLARGQLR